MKLWIRGMVCIAGMAMLGVAQAQDVDVAVTKTANVDSVLLGENVMFTITVSNLGTNPATGVMLEDVLPGSLGLVSLTSLVSCTNIAGTITCDVGTLDTNDVVSVGILVTGELAGTITNTATVTANENDVDLGNNTATQIVTVVSGVDLAVTKTPDNDSVTLSNNVTYTIVVTNAGTELATGVLLTDVLPDSFAFVSFPTDAGCTNVNGTITCDVGDLDANESVEVQIEATALATGSITNTVEVLGNEADLNVSDNTATAVVAVVSGGEGPDLTGDWTTLETKCKKDGTNCKAKGRLEVRNEGSVDANSSFIRFYLSTDAVFDEGDTFLKQVATGKVKHGKPKMKKLSAKIADDFAGQFILAVIDADDTVSESNESNNVVVFGPL